MPTSFPGWRERERKPGNEVDLSHGSVHGERHERGRGDTELWVRGFEESTLANAQHSMLGNPRGDEERCVTSARTAAKETSCWEILSSLWLSRHFMLFVSFILGDPGDSPDGTKIGLRPIPLSARGSPWMCEFKT